MTYFCQSDTALLEPLFAQARSQTRLWRGAKKLLGRPHVFQRGQNILKCLKLVVIFYLLGWRNFFFQGASLPWLRAWSVLNTTRGVAVRILGNCDSLRRIYDRQHLKDVCRSFENTPHLTLTKIVWLEVSFWIILIPARGPMFLHGDGLPEPGLPLPLSLASRSRLYRPVLTICQLKTVFKKPSTSLKSTTSLFITFSVF